MMSRTPFTLNAPLEIHEFRRPGGVRLLVLSLSHFPNDCWLSPDAFPAMSASTEISSSSCGQWIPSPRPIRLHVERSSTVAWPRRGYHARGTEIVRPSLKSTVSVSSVVSTFVARGTFNSIAEELIPCLVTLVLMVGDDSL